MQNMFGDFNKMFGYVENGMCKVSMSGSIAVKTSTGYKTYNVKTGKLTNCSNFAFDMDGMFFVVPTCKVQCGDIILVNGKPRCVISVNSKSVEAFSYEDGTIDKFPIEHHVFMGNSYCYGKIFSPFAGKGNKNVKQLMKAMIMGKMFTGMSGNPAPTNGNNSNNMFSGMNPMMFMMMGNGNPFSEMFDGAFDFGESDVTEEDTDEETEEEGDGE